MIRCIVALTTILSSVLPAINGNNSLVLPSETKGSFSVENQDNTPTVRGEKSETITQGGSSDSGEPASQERPSVRASDPSMWEEQPHWDCNTKSGKGPDDPLGCVLGRRMPIPQDDTTDASGGSGPRTITTRQAATLIAQGSGITRQPPGPKVIISMAFIVYTNPTPRYQTTTILGSPIEVEFTPAS